MEGDAWVISFLEAENRLLIGGCRRKCLSILKTLRDQVWMDSALKYEFTQPRSDLCS